MSETENTETKMPSAEPKITVDHGTGRWNKTFHLFDLEGHEIVLEHRHATSLARRILAICGGKE